MFESEFRHIEKEANTAMQPLRTAPRHGRQWMTRPGDVLIPSLLASVVVLMGCKSEKPKESVQAPDAAIADCQSLDPLRLLGGKYKDQVTQISTMHLAHMEQVLTDRAGSLLGLDNVAAPEKALIAMARNPVKVEALSRTLPKQLETDEQADDQFETDLRKLVQGVVVPVLAEFPQNDRARCSEDLAAILTKLIQAMSWTRDRQQAQGQGEGPASAAAILASAEEERRKAREAVKSRHSAYFLANFKLLSEAGTALDKNDMVRAKRLQALATLTSTTGDNVGNRFKKESARAESTIAKSIEAAISQANNSSTQ